MKVFVLLCNDTYQDHCFTDIVSIHKTRPNIPESSSEACGCFHKDYLVTEMEVKP